MYLITKGNKFVFNEKSEADRLLLETVSRMMQNFYSVPKQAVLTIQLVSLSEGCVCWLIVVQVVLSYSAVGREKHATNT